MSNYKKLVIDGIIVDLPVEDLPFSMQYSVEKEGFISASGGKRSITLPSTKTNDALFEDWFRAATVNPGAGELKPFFFQIGGIRILSGQAQLISAPLASASYRFRGKGYKVDLYGNNADWFLKLEDKRIKDLTFQNFIWNQIITISGWFNSYDAADDYCTTLVKWKEWNLPGEVSIEEYTHALFIKTILQRALNSVGYTINSIFLDSDNFKRLILLVPPIEKYPQAFSEDYLNISYNQATPTALPASPPIVYTTLIYDVPVQIPNIGPNPYNPATGVYTVQNSGFYQISASLQNVSGALNLYRMQVLKNGVPIYTTNANLVGNNEFMNIEVLQQFVAGDTFQIQASAQNAGNVNFGNLTVIGEANLAFGGQWLWKYIIPEQWKITDFIVGLQQMFNLRFESDTISKVVTIEPADDYYYQQLTPTPISGAIGPGFYQNSTERKEPKTDLSKDAELYNETNQPQTTIFAYKSNDETVEDEEENEPLGFYSAQYVLPNNRFNNRTETKENAFFAKTLCTNDDTIQGSNSPLVPQIPLIYPNNYLEDPTAIEADYNVEPRILYFAGIRPISIDGTHVVQFNIVDIQFPKAFMVNYQNSADWSISFADEQVQGVSVRGLLSSFWLQDFARKRVGKKLEFFYFWDKLGISNLSFREKFYLDGSLWILQEIDGFKPTTIQSTNTELLLDQAPTSEDLNNIENTALNALIILE